jgi:hypothetical protein
MKPTVGHTFTHLTMLDPSAWPQRRKAAMRVTRVTKTAVYYTYADSADTRGAWWLDLDTWIARYANSYPAAPERA